MNKKQQTTSAGAAGGKASGDCKRRNMKGCKMGRGSAGRADAGPRETRYRRADRFLDVLIAARAWLRDHEDPWVARSHFMQEGGGM